MKQVKFTILMRGILLALLITMAPWLGINPRPAAASAAVNTFTVNSTADLPDTDVGVSTCQASNNLCTLRAAIMQANFTVGADIITLPAGVFQLTRAGDDAVAVLGDLDITDDLTIQGAGSGLTFVDGNGAVTGDRVFQITTSAKVTSISGLTIRNGKKVTNTFDEGGGLLWEGTDGGTLHLSDVVFQDNSANYGGGLTLRYNTAVLVDLENVVIRANRAIAAAGGGMTVDFGTGFGSFLLNNSQVYNNSAFQAGGMGLFGSAPQFAPLRIEHTDIYSNTVMGLAGGIEADAGSAAFPLQILNSQIHNNRANQGGAMTIAGHVVISQTIVTTNTAINQGGGLYIRYGSTTTDIVQSTLNGNTAQYGGGIYSAYLTPLSDHEAVTLTNSTLSSNSASRDGAGLYATGGSFKLFNATVAANRVAVPDGDPYAGLGGGVFITNTAVITAASTIIADNAHSYGALAPVPDDCHGTIFPRVFNLIETVTGCTFVTPHFFNIFGQDPLLGPLQFNGGATPTQALLAGSPAIDPGGDHCSTPAGGVLNIDQRGFPRPHGAYCDIGAFEYYPPSMFLPVVER